MWGRRRRTVLALAGAMFWLGAGSAQAGVTISFQPPLGAHVSSEGTPPYFRTTNPQPTIGIQADGGAAIRCGLDVLAPDAGACGPPLPSCAAALCASYRPPAPLADRPAVDHTLAVAVLDKNGQIVSESDQGFTVDGTPPSIRFQDVMRDNPLRPVFEFVVADDSPSGAFITVTDAFSCSLVPLRAAPAWRSCPTAAGSFENSATYRLPRRHRDYRFWIRATDDFGRTTVVHHDYDPVPCDLHASLPRRLAGATAGIPVRLDCSYVGAVDVGLWPTAVNGRTFARTPAQTVSTRPLLAGIRVRGRGSRWSAHRRLAMSRSFATQTLRFHSVRFLLTACPVTDANPCADRQLDASWSYLTFVARR